ncbi:hypothetical protein A0H81_14517 [Grifola frondosa]|uniref:Uncharacterized protein n=1 Tax=Grifola frondosa TaxID=5627 RepID=A0A1C7LL45_GRIFR|nr:hypothetical protein A0H81_14517 [Grifola frondosa]
MARVRVYFAAAVLPAASGSGVSAEVLVGDAGTDGDASDRIAADARDIAVCIIGRYTFERQLVEEGMYPLSIPTHRPLMSAGFFGAQQFSTSYHQLIQVEDTGLNRMLAPYNSVREREQRHRGLIGTVYTTNWTAVYLVRMLPHMQARRRGVTLDLASVQAMQ